MNSRSSSLAGMVGNVDSTSVKKSPSHDSLTVTIEGWILHPDQPIVDLYFEASGVPRVQTKRFARPDVANLYSSFPVTSESGYSVQFEIGPQNLASPLILSLFATLEDGSRINTAIAVPLALSEKDSGKHEQVTAVSYEARSILDQVALRSFITSAIPLKFPSCSSPALSVIVVTYNRVAETFACLSALAEQVTSQIEVIVIDNASTDVTHSLLDLLENVQVIRNDENLHFLSAARQGAIAARGEILLFLNNDAVIMPGALEATLESFANHPRLGVLGARLIHPHGRLQEVGGMVFSDGSNLGNGVGEHPLAVPFLLQRSVDYCSGAFLATPRSLWESIGGFDLRYLPAYYEDVDYCFMAKQKNYEVLVEPRIAVIHQEGAVTNNAAEAQTLMARNREKFREKHLTQISSLGTTKTRSYEIIPPAYASFNNVLMIDDLFPVERNGQGAPRAKLIVETLLAEGFYITFVALNERESFPEESDLYSNPQISFHTVRRGDAFTEFLALNGASFGQIIVSRPHNMEDFQAIRTKYPICAQNARVVYDAEAIFALREIRKKELEMGTPLHASEVEKIVSQEILAVKKADQFWSVSSSESMEFIKRGFDNVTVLGFGTVPTERKPRLADRSGLLFVGPMSDAQSPNVDGLLWYARLVLPLLTSELAAQNSRPSPWAKLLGRTAKQPSISLTHIGINRLTDLPAPGHISSRGQVMDLAPVYDAARLFIAPIWFGSGIPIKAIEAAANGLPIVASSFVAAQLDWKNEVELLVADSPESFAKQIMRLLLDDTLWRRLREAALDRVAKDFSRERFIETLSNSMSHQDTN